MYSFIKSDGRNKRCTGSSRKEFSRLQFETSVGDSRNNLHLMQPLVLDEIDVEGFNEITLAMVITNQDLEPADLPITLAEMPVTEATEHNTLGSLSNVSDNSEAAAVTPVVPSLASHPGPRRAQSGEEKVMRDRQKHLLIDTTPCGRFCRKHCKDLTRENHFTTWNRF